MSRPSYARTTGLVAYEGHWGRGGASHARILALRPFGGSHAGDVAVVVDELGDRRVEFVGTTGWLDATRGDSNGTVHPSARGHRKQQPQSSEQYLERSPLT